MTCACEHRRCSTLSKRLALLVWLSGLLWAGGVQTQERIYRSNTHYEQGDWITYTTTRFVRHLCLGDRYVYFATTGGLSRLDFYTNRYDPPWTVSNGLASNNLFLVAYDFNTGLLWCVTDVSVSFQEPATQIWNNRYFDEMEIGNRRITSIGFGDDRRVYLATSQRQWFESDNTSADFRASTSSNAVIQWHGALAPREPDPPFLFMSDGYLYSERDRTITDFELRKFPLTCWLRDRFQNLYVGTWGLGAGVANLATFRLELYPYGLWNPAVDAIEPDQDALWLGGVQKEEPGRAGVTEWAIDRHAPYYYEAYLHTGFSDDRVTCIAVDDPRVWFGTRNGLVLYHRDKDQWHSFHQVHHLLDERINDLLVDDRYLWVATKAGVSRVIKRTVNTDSMRIQTIAYRDLGGLAVYDLDQQGSSVWMGTEYGIYLYDSSTDSGGFYQGLDDPGSQRIYAVSVCEDEVWFGGEDGIAGLDLAADAWIKGAGRLYDLELNVYRIKATPSAVWAGTDQGVLKFDRERQRWVRFTIEDGLPDNRVRAMYPDGDYIWFGTAAGLTRFYWNSPFRID